MRLSIYTFLILGLFSASWILSKDIVSGLPAVHATGLRLAATATALWLIVAIHKPGRLPISALPGALFGFILLAVFGFAAYFLLSFAALVPLQASQLSMVLASIPAITYLIALTLGMDQPNALKFIGVPLVTVGAVWFNLADVHGLSVGHMAGLAMAAGAALSYALYGLCSKRFLAGRPLLGSLAWITTFAALMFVPVYIVDPEPLLTLTPDGIVKIALLGAVLSAPIYVLYQVVLAAGGVVYANSIGVMAPFVILAAEMAVGFRYDVTLPEIVAMMIGAFGVALVFIDAMRGDAQSQAQTVPDTTALAQSELRRARLSRKGSQ